MILCADNDAACAALATGAARSLVVLVLVFVLRAIAARYAISIWPERVPTEVKSAGRPSREKEPPFPTELKGEIATIADLSFHVRSFLDASARGLNKADGRRGFRAARANVG